MSPLDTALLLHAVGYRVVPVFNKRPGKKGWESIEWTSELICAEFERGADGVGLQLVDLIEFDCDGPGAEEEFAKLGLPESVSWKSARGLHPGLYRLPDGADLSHVPRKIGNLEIRHGAGQQTVIPPSGGREWIRSLLEHEPVEFAEPAWPIEEIDEPGAQVEEQSGPGREFNRRASWAEILEPLGHKLVGERTENGKPVQDWLRPGGDKDRSATTGFCHSTNDDDKLFVFSTNMEPFVAGTAYSKFAAYALTRHDGNYKAAARDLAEQGYVEAVDASVFDDENDIIYDTVSSGESVVCDTTPEDRLTDLLLLPGFVTRVAHWHLERSQIMDVRAGAVAGILAMSWMLGRKVKLYDGTRSNLSMLLLGEPGSGKTETANTLSALLANCDNKRFIQRDIVSGQALEEALAVEPNLLFIRDEVQDLLTTADKSQYAQTLLSRMKEIFSAVRGVYEPRRKASEKQLDPIPYPSLAVLFMGTPAGTRNAISDQFYEDGFMARMLLVHTNESAPVNINVRNTTVPDELSVYVQRWRSSGVFEDTGRDGELPPLFRDMPSTAGAVRRLGEIKQEWQTMGEGVEKHLLRRGQELTCKLCMIAAASEAMDREIDESLVDRCAKLVEVLIQVKLDDLEQRSFHEKREHGMARLMRLVAKQGGCTTFRKLYRGLRMPANQVRDYALEMVLRGELATDAKITVDGSKFATMGEKIWMRGCAPKESKS
jgi:hypothetical protein